MVFDVKCSAVLPQAIRELGGEPVMWKTGYTSLSAKMREVDAVLGGELSGHTIFPFPGRYFDDGAFAGAMLLYALGELGQTLREVLARIRCYRRLMKVGYPSPKSASLL